MVLACRIEQRGHQDKKVRVSHTLVTDLPCARANPERDPTCPIVVCLEDESLQKREKRFSVNNTKPSFCFNDNRRYQWLSLCQNEA